MSRNRCPVDSAQRTHFDTPRESPVKFGHKRFARHDLRRVYQCVCRYVEWESQIVKTEPELMNLIIPSIGNHHIQRLSACADVALLPGNPLITWLRTRKDRILHKDAKYSDTEWIHSTCGVIKGDEPRAHLHLDLAVDSYFEDRQAPATSTIEAIQEEVHKFESLELDVDIECKFRIQRESLPKRSLIAAILGLSTRSMGAKMNLTGAQMTVGDKVYRSFRWVLVGDDALEVAIESQKKIVLDDHYLETLVSICTDGFNRFVLEKRKPNETEPQKPS